MKKMYTLSVESFEVTIVDEMRISEIEYNHQFKKIKQAVEKQVELNRKSEYASDECIAEHRRSRLDYDKYYTVIDRFELEGAILRLSKIVAKKGYLINNSLLRRKER